MQSNITKTTQFQYFSLMQPDLNKSCFSISNPIQDTIILQTTQDRYDMNCNVVYDLKTNTLTESLEQTDGVLS